MESLNSGIRKIRIHDFRGITDLELSFLGLRDLPNDVVVIGGPNGSGKTTVLEACLWAIGYSGTLNGKVGKSAIRNGAQAFRIEIEIQTDSKNIQSYQYGPKSMPKGIIPCLYFSSWRAPALVGALSITSGKRGRRPEKTEQNRLWRIKQFLINARAHDLFPTAVVPSNLNGKSRFRYVMDALNEAWSMFFPGEFFTVEPLSDDPDAGFDVFLNVPASGRLSVDVLSSGQLELFCFAGDLLIENFKDGIIVIDEPELHLDAQWHRQLIRVIRLLKPRCQLIVGTHSSEIYDSVHSFQRHFLVSSDDPRAAAWITPISGLVEQVID